ncbi:hypothetical protein AKJ09_07395 [Labilithrix luteola]|uniref:Uncharacterized protein n=1 Tax=Labilithrix luteola TaxID=1391654 RepID=A0A0K1Q506_9BACT|nr:hypothetical protein AKJ09_07395 [Labilithrix luteola]
MRPKLGFPGVVLLHLAFAIAMPGLWSFGLVMVAMATLFLPAASSSRRNGRISDVSRVS